MQILLTHPTGNANVRGALAGLYKNNLLESFHTTVASYPNNLWGRLGRIQQLSEFRKRAFPMHLAPLTKTYPHNELMRMLAMKMGWTKLLTHEVGRFSVDSIYRDLDQRVASYIHRIENLSAVYGYEDGSYFCFQEAKKRGVKCIYDLPIGYWKSMRFLLQEEHRKNPEWAITLGGFSDSSEKLKRKDKELELADVILVASSFTKKTLESYPEQLAPIHVVPYGFPAVNEERVYIPLSGRKLKVLFVGGLSQRKGISYVFDAVKDLESQVGLTVVGRGNIEGCPALKQALAKHTYIPALPHDKILELMAEHDVFVFPSLFEGFGMVITEAMSQGTPVITTNRTCGPDIIKQGKNGWIVDTSS